jgi:signal transduction histidine kinase
MKYKHSLRFRITLSFFLFGTLLMIGVAAGVHFAIEDIENRLLSESMQVEFKEFKEQYHANPHNPLPRSATVKSYLVDSRSDPRLPSYLRGLSFGSHEIDLDEKYMQAMLGPVNGKILVLTRDITLFEEREDSVAAALTVAVIAASLLALWLGYGLSQRVIAPVTSLAQTVATLSPDKPESIVSTSYADDEVGELAHAFERYLERLNEFISREQEFTSNASHELRTPLTVIQGAVELMSVDPDLSARNRKVLQRIERASDAMSQMVDTLLLLARENGVPGKQTCSLSEVVHETIASHQDLLQDKPVKLVARVNHDVELPVACSVAAIVLSNLVRNAVAHTIEGEIILLVDDHRVTVTDTGTGIQRDDLPHIFDRHFRGQRDNAEGSGIGLAIVKRICDRYGWTITVSSVQGQGTTVEIKFASSGVN